MKNSTVQPLYDFTLFQFIYYQEYSLDTTYNCYFHLEKVPIPPAENFPKISDVEIESQSLYKELVQDINILLMTATDIELRGIMGYLKPKEPHNRIIETLVNGEKVYIGKYGQCPVVVGISAPARSHQGLLDACITTTKIMMKIEFLYVIAVGICYGMDKDKTSSGDVIVSSFISDCTSLRIGETNTGEYSFTRRGNEYPVGHNLLQVFGTPYGYSYIQDGREFRAHCAPIIARPDLVDNSEYKKKLKELRSDALGGEMEGAGIMAAIQKVFNGAQAIVIKAICDWGDGKKGDAADWKPFSSHAAARYVHHQMDKPTGAVLNKDNTKNEFLPLKHN